MKNRFFYVLGLLALSTATFAQTASLNLSKSFNIDGNQAMEIDLPGEVNLVAWEKPYIQIAIEAEVININQKIADELARVGRYDLNGSSENGTFELTAPNQKKTVRIRGQELVETMHYTIHVPSELKVEINGNLTDAMVSGEQ